jgi:hypothetical protein
MCQLLTAFANAWRRELAGLARVRLVDGSPADVLRSVVVSRGNVPALNTLKIVSCGTIPFVSMPTP